MQQHHILGAAFNQGGQFPTIGVVNLATVPLSDTPGAPENDLTKLVAALQRYVDEYVVPIWGYPAKFIIYPDLKSIPADQWQFLLMDDADSANALGYHDLTKNGQPVTKVFVKTTKADKALVSVTASHEAAEMLLDPGAQLWAQKPDGSFVAYELADPVEEQTFDIDGITMSNFVFPSYFESWKHPKGTKFDYLGKLTKPFQIAKGGYLIVAKGGGKVTEVFGSVAKSKRFAREDRTGHRSEHRKPDGLTIVP